LVTTVGTGLSPTLSSSWRCALVSSITSSC
jgi:hypothetical protein